MFTKNQLEYLSRVQAGDDYHCSCFIDVLKYYYENPENRFIAEVEISAEEFDELITILSRGSSSDIWNLQTALNFLSLLPSEMFI